MPVDESKIAWLRSLSDWPRVPLAQLPTPIHRLSNLGKHVGAELWIKRDDLTGLAGGGNKTRKLEFLVGDAIQSGADTLATVGAIQSNHTRQTAAAAARSGLKCALLHFGWTKDAGPMYRQVGNILLSSMMGADLYLDDTARPIEDNGPLDEFDAWLRTQGHKPYVIPGGGSDHRLEAMGMRPVQLRSQHKLRHSAFISTASCTVQAVAAPRRAWSPDLPPSMKIPV